MDAIGHSWSQPYWDHRIIKVGKDLQDQLVQPSSLQDLWQWKESSMKQKFMGILRMVYMCVWDQPERVKEQHRADTLSLLILKYRCL